MQKFKIQVSKQGKNFTFVLSAENEIKARERVHIEGYSILHIEEITNISDFGNEYIFEAEKAGKMKKGKIIGDDIFKVYLKLRKKLGYNVLELYGTDQKNISEEEKKEIIRELDGEYKMYLGTIHKKEEKEKKEEKIKVNKEFNKNQINYDNFYLKKNLEETYKLINFILIKIKNLIDGKEKVDISNEDIVRLKNIYNSIIKIKSTTNILKLREIGEKALETIGILELRKLEKTKSKDTKKLLGETNELLKKIGSKKSFIEKKYDIKYYIGIIKKYISKIKTKKDKNKKEKIDKTSYYYIKNLFLLNKYKEKLKINNKNIILNFFNSKKREHYLLINKVIRQNIILLSAKIKGFNYSYTILKNGYKNILNFVLILLSKIRDSLFFVILFYSIFLIFIFNFNYYFNLNDFNFSGIKYFLFVFLFYYLLYISKNLYLIILNIFISYFVIIFFIINF